MTDIEPGWSRFFLFVLKVIVKVKTWLHLL